VYSESRDSILEPTKLTVREHDITLVPNSPGTTTTTTEWKTPEQARDSNANVTVLKVQIILTKNSQIERPDFGIILTNTTKTSVFFKRSMEELRFKLSGMIQNGLVKTKTTKDKRFK